MIQQAIDLADRHRASLLAIAIATLSALAWTNQFVQDDAFISFRYAQHLAEGDGLVWNAGERVEGYTNFLWTLLMAIAFVIGADPITFSTVLSWLFFPASLFLTARIASAVTDARWAPLAAVVLLGTNYTFSAYATGGLETQLHAFLLLGVTTLALRMAGTGAPRAREAIATSILAAGALMTRMDSALPLCVLYAYVALGQYPNLRADPRGVLRAAAMLVAPGAILVCAWLGWKFAYYGDILPNTYYAKMAPVSETWPLGLRYLSTFVDSYWLWPLVLLLLFALGIVRAFTRPLGLLACLVVVGCLYAVRIGGDFMEFRLLVPILPALFVLLAWVLVSSCRPRWLGAVAIAGIVAGSAHHARTFQLTHFIEPVPLLQAHIDEPPYLWARTGRVLGELFADGDEPVWIATSAAGAVPFYSRLPTIDILGLNDAHVARTDITVPIEHLSPGHYRSATFEYLVERNVNLLIGTPWVSERAPGPRPRFGSYGLVRFGIVTPSAESIPPTARMKVIEIDLDVRHRLFVLYLMPNAHVDEVIRRENLRVHDVIRPAAAGGVSALSRVPGGVSSLFRSR